MQKIMSPPRNQIDTMIDAQPGTPIVPVRRLYMRKTAAAIDRRTTAKPRLKDVDQRAVAERREGVDQDREAPKGAVGRRRPAHLRHRRRPLLEARDHPEACEKDFLIAMADERLHVPPGHQPRREHVVGDGMREQLIEDPEEQLTGRPLEPAALSRLLDAVDDIRASLAHGVAEQRKPAGILLEVAVDQEDQVAAGMSEPGHQRLVVAEVPRQVDDAHARIASADLQRHPKRVVCRAVVDEHDLVGVRDRRRRFRAARVKLFEMRRRSEHRRHDRQLERALAHHAVDGSGHTAIM